MFSKKEKIQDNFYDRKRKDFQIQFFEDRRNLRECTKKVFVKKEVINLYPEGPDKEKAKLDLDKAQYSLLCTIGAYDNTLNEYKNFCLENKEKFQSTIDWTMPLFETTSHNVIESTYESITGIKYNG